LLTDAKLVRLFRKNKSPTLQATGFISTNITLAIEIGGKYFIK
jgi:hypothetical protein